MAADDVVTGAAPGGFDLEAKKLQYEEVRT